MEHCWQKNRLSAPWLVQRQRSLVRREVMHGREAKRLAPSAVSYLWQVRKVANSRSAIVRMLRRRRTEPIHHKLKRPMRDGQRHFRPTSPAHRHQLARARWMSRRIGAPSVTTADEHSAPISGQMRLSSSSVGLPANWLDQPRRPAVAVDRASWDQTNAWATIVRCPSKVTAGPAYSWKPSSSASLTRRQKVSSSGPVSTR